ncbi:MAG: exo-alpha-sialidase [Ornithinimicrobium sp.]
MHAIERNAPDGNVLLATHDGLWSAEGKDLSQVGPQIDLMGFSVLRAGTYRASGHPGPGLGLDEPAGLIETRDAGQTWSGLSRGGESDFHLLEANEKVTVGFDGVLRSSTDGTSWQDQSPPDGLVDLALQPTGQDLLATASEGLLISTDLGVHWDLVPAAPPLVLLDWVDTTTAVGISNEGEVYVSTDAGFTWQERDQLDSGIQAMSANRTSEGGIELLVAEEAGFRAVLIS